MAELKPDAPVDAKSELDEDLAATYNQPKLADTLLQLVGPPDGELESAASSSASGAPRKRKQPPHAATGPVFKSVYVSKLVIWQKSGVLRSFLDSDDEWERSDDGRFQLLPITLESADDVPVVEQLLRFMYGMPLEPVKSAGQALPLLQWADRWHVPSAFGAVARMLEAVLKPPSTFGRSERRLPTWEDYVAVADLPDTLHQHPALATVAGMAVNGVWAHLASAKWLDQTMMDDTARAKLQTLPCRVVRRLLQHDHLRVLTENTVFRAIAVWCDGAVEAAAKQERVAAARADLYPLVRFPRLQKRFLMDHVLPALAPDLALADCRTTVVSKGSADPTRALCANAVHYHLSSPLDQAAIVQANVNPSQHEPRKVLASFAWAATFICDAKDGAAQITTKEGCPTWTYACGYRVDFLGHFADNRFCCGIANYPGDVVIRFLDVDEGLWCEVGLKANGHWQVTDITPEHFARNTSAFVRDNTITVQYLFTPLVDG